MASELHQWCKKQLAQLMDSQINNDVVNYLLSVDSSEKLREALQDMLDKSPASQQFIDALILRMNFKTEETHVVEYRKESDDDNRVRNRKPKKKRPEIAESNGDERQSELKKKEKYVSLYGKDGNENIELPGRHHCDCQARKHALINNCLGCGKIVCNQEKSGPCLFCGNFVCTEEESTVLNRGSNKSTKLRNSIMRLHEEYLVRSNGGNCNADSGFSLKNPFNLTSPDTSALANKATVQKNKLIEFDRTSAKRTQVIDDECDYYNTGWLSNKERQTLKSRQEALREEKYATKYGKAQKINIDFMGREVKETPDEINLYDQNDIVLQSVTGQNMQRLDELERPMSLLDIKNPFTDISVQYIPSSTDIFPELKAKNQDGGKKSTRLQNEDLQLMSDEGKCLSVHQPFASLLVAGIKCYEGRDWYTKHRGRLWIASTVKKPSQEEIENTEAFYRHSSTNIRFPKKYPLGCLLGCVDVLDCTSQSIDHEENVNECEDSSYILHCTNAKVLPIQLPILGRPKIWSLDSTTLQAVLKIIEV